MKKVLLYTDGACSGNPGIGGWGVVLIYKQHIKKFSGVCENTTNNQMELTAVIEGIKLLKESCDVTIYSDSAYVCNAFLQNWIDSWKINNWKNSNNKPVKNIELWELLLKVLVNHKVEWIKVKGHSDNEYNNMCDKLATTEIKNYK